MGGCHSDTFEPSSCNMANMELTEEKVNDIETNDKVKKMEGDTTPAVPHHGHPLVTAILTTHNRGPGMVLRAVNSILNQTYPNIELIVIDDSDPSFPKRAAVERAVRNASGNILYLKHDVCQGACAARNTGLSHAKGYYVGFLDDDDEWMPTKIEEQLKCFSDEKTALVYCRIISVEDKKNIETLGRPWHENGYVFEKLLVSNFIGCTSNPLIKKECLDTVGGFDVKMESCQDYDLWLRLAFRYPIQSLNVPLIKYHIHPGKRITTDDKKRINGVERIFSKYADYYKKNRLAEYRRGVMLIPNYQKLYGRKRALALWASCVKKYPGNVVENIRKLFMIIVGIDHYNLLKSYFLKLRERIIQRCFLPIRNRRK